MAEEKFTVPEEPASPDRAFFRIQATDEWYKKMAELEEGCDICAGGGDIDDLIFHHEPEHEEEEK